jgi:hypothetical protein
MEEKEKEIREAKEAADREREELIVGAQDLGYTYAYMMYSYGVE